MKKTPPKTQLSRIYRDEAQTFARVLIERIEQMRWEFQAASGTHIRQNDFYRKLQISRRSLNEDRNASRLIQLARLKDILHKLDGQIILHWTALSPDGLRSKQRPLALEQLEEGQLPDFIQQKMEDKIAMYIAMTNEQKSALFDLSNCAYRRIHSTKPSPIAWESFVHILVALGIGYSIRFGGEDETVVISCQK